MKFYYFDLYGKGEAIRVLFDQAKVDYEDVRVTGPTWIALKADKEKCPFGQVPVLEDDGKVYTQSNAILRYIGTKYGLYPKDAVQAYECDQLIDLSCDFREAIVKGIFSKSSEEEK
jgi:glutathione S-transferase